MVTAKELIRLVWVKWVDSSSDSRWSSIEDQEHDAANRDMTCESVGWVVHDDKHRIMLAQSKSSGFDQVDNTILIPKIAIVGVMEIVG